MAHCRMFSPRRQRCQEVSLTVVASLATPMDTATFRFASPFATARVAYYEQVERTAHAAEIFFACPQHHRHG